ncbi:MAG: LytTR family DNA-binding domain-containing protein [Bacteroidota bacterium]
MKVTSTKQPFSQFKPYLHLVCIGLLYFAAMNLFEAGQQLYYIKRFGLANDPVTYWDLLQGHALRWLIWLLFTLPFTRFVLKNRITQATFTPTFLAKYFIAILVALSVTTGTISCLQMVQNGAVLGEFLEYFQFFMAQKFALFFSGYIGTVILIHLYIKQRELDGQLYGFLALKEKYQAATAALNQQQSADKELISIKIGDKVKLIPLAEIIWIQSADYCVQIHTKGGRAYFIRQSMKAMENRLGNKGFVRIHRSAIVNVSAIASFQFNPTAQVQLFSGNTLPIANSRLGKIRELARSMGI